MLECPRKEVRRGIRVEVSRAVTFEESCNCQLFYLRQYIGCISNFDRLVWPASCKSAMSVQNLQRGWKVSFEHT